MSQVGYIVGGDLVLPSLPPSLATIARSPRLPAEYFIHLRFGELLGASSRSYAAYIVN
jgi:hypothetical protein